MANAAAPSQYLPPSAANAVGMGLANFARNAEADWREIISGGLAPTLSILESGFAGAVGKLEGIPLIGPLIALAITGTENTIHKLELWSDDLRSMLGNPVGLGTGTVTASIVQYLKSSGTDLGKFDVSKFDFTNKATSILKNLDESVNLGFYDASVGFNNTGTSLLKNLTTSGPNLGQFNASQIAGAINTGVTFLVGASNVALSTLLQNLNTTGQFAASAVSGALNTAVTISGNAISALFNSSGALASALTGAINTAVTISGNAISGLFSSSGALASALTGALNTAVTISGNAVSALFNGSGLIASKIAGALNPAVTFLVGASNIALSTVLGNLNATGQFAASALTGAINTAVTFSGTALSTLLSNLNSSGQFAASAITGALNTAVTISGNALSTLFNSSGALASALTGALNTAVTISGNAISALFNSSGALASILTGAMNTGVTIFGNAISALFNSTGVLASKITGAINTSVTFLVGAANIALSTLLQNLDNLGNFAAAAISGALNTAVTIAGNAVSALFNASGLIASKIAGALNPAVTFLVSASNVALSTLLQNLDTAGNFAASALSGAINTAVTIAGTAISALFNGSGLIASKIAGALNTAVTISGNAVSALFNGSGALASALTGAINTAVTISGNAISTLFSGSGVLASALTGAINTAVTISGNAISALFSGSGVLASALTGAINTAVTISGNAISLLFNSSGVLASKLTGTVAFGVSMAAAQITATIGGVSSDIQTHVGNVVDYIEQGVNNNSNTGKAPSTVKTNIVSFITGLFNAHSGSSASAASAADVASAAAANLSTTGSNSTGVAQTAAALGTISYGAMPLIAKTIDFGTYANASSMPAIFTQLTAGYATTSSRLGISNGTATIVAGTSGQSACYYNVEPTGSDDQIISVVPATSVAAAVVSGLGLIGRCNSAGNSFVTALILGSGVTLLAYVSGTAHSLATAPGVNIVAGATYSLVCGTEDGTTYYDVLCNGVSIIGGPVNDNGNTGGTPFGQIGSSFRYGGGGVANAVSPEALSSLTIADNTNLLIAPSGPAAPAPVAGPGTTTSTGYTSTLSGATAPTATVTIGSSGMARVTIEGGLSNSTASATTWMGFAASGANTIAASDTYALEVKMASGQLQLGRSPIITGLDPGVTTFTPEFKVGAGTGSYANISINVEPL